MSVGDIMSAERGSGARFNDGKPALELLPLRVLADALRADRMDPGQAAALAALRELAAWQEDGSPTHLYAALAALGNPWNEIAAVLDYGRRKYAAWNWAKGMAWSICVGCAVRHLVKIIDGEPNDPESGMPHRAHVGCNVVFLATFQRTYPEGDDRPRMLQAVVPAP